MEEGEGGVEGVRGVFWSKEPEKCPSSEGGGGAGDGGGEEGWIRMTSGRVEVERGQKMWRVRRGRKIKRRVSCGLVHCQ